MKRTREYFCRTVFGSVCVYGIAHAACGRSFCLPLHRRMEFSEQDRDGNSRFFVRTPEPKNNTTTTIIGTNTVSFVFYVGFFFPVRWRTLIFNRFFFPRSSRSSVSSVFHFHFRIYCNVLK